MKKEKSSSEKAIVLRQKAEQKLNVAKKKTSEKLIGSEIDEKNLVHELEVHQIELEMQNDELRKVQLKLEESSKKYFDLYDLAPVGYFTLDEKGIILELNLTAANLLGENRKNLVSKKLYNFIRREDRDIFYLHLEKFKKIEGKQSCELRLVKKNGVEFYCHLLCMPIYNEISKKTNYRVAMTDVSDRIQAEEILVETKARYASSFENSRDGIIVFHKDKKIIAVNRELVKLSGYTKEELLSMRLEKLFPAANSVKTVDRMKQLQLGKKLKLFETGLITKHGNTIPVEINVTVLKDSYGYDVVFQGNVRNITQRKQAEEALVESEEYFRTLIENSSDVISILDDKGVIRYESPSHKKVLGYETGKLIGENVFGLVHPDDRERISMQFVKLLKRSNEIEQVNFRILHKDGTWIYLEGTGTNLLDSSKIRGIVVNYRDVTEKMKIEEALKESEGLNRAVLLNSPLGIAVRDKRGTLILHNHAWQKLWGLTADEIEAYKNPKKELKFNYINSYLEDHQDKIQEVYQKGGEYYIKEVKLKITQKRAAEWVSQYFYALTDAKDNVNRVVIVTEDITERKQSEELLIQRMKQMEIFNELAIDRELLINDHRKEINELLEKLGEKPKYRVVG